MGYCPEGVVPIPCKWVFDIKTDSMGRIIRFKARLVAGGHRQKEGIDYTETFSPTVSWDSVRLFLAFTVLLGLVPLQLDVDTAYLYSDIEPGMFIYMKPPPGYERADGKVWLLLKSLYGLKQAGRNWNNLIHSELLAQGFVPIDEDACVYIRHNGDGDVVLLLLYVDDILVSASNVDLLRELVDYLRSNFKLKLLGVPTDMGLNRSHAPSQLLGLQLIWGEKFSSVHISAEKLVREVVKDFYEDKGTAPRTVPMDPNHRISKTDCIPESSNMSTEVRTMQKRCRSIVGVFIFLVTTCRVDIKLRQIEPDLSKLNQLFFSPSDSTKGGIRNKYPDI